jgi:hypothetical protein
MLYTSPLCLYFQYVKYATSLLPGLCSLKGCVYSGHSMLGHTGKLQGVSKFTSPTFQANVSDIEQ